jgi:hypothetical protein
VSRRRCLIVGSVLDLPADISANDRAEVERFADYLRLVAAARAAGVPHREATAAIYPDVYPDETDAQEAATPAPGRP